MSGYNHGVYLTDRPDFANVLRLDQAAMPMVLDMKKNGFQFDLGHFQQLYKEIRTEREENLSELRRIAKFDINPASPKQVGQYLFEKLRLRPKHGAMVRQTASGAWPTADDVLDRMAGVHPAVDLILKDRELGKIEGTYVKPVVFEFPYRWPDLRVRPDLTFNIVETGRLSCRNPNLQNQPSRSPRWAKAIRNGYVARKGHVLVSLDLSQIEVVWTAHLSQDEMLMRALWNGLDNHYITAATIFNCKDCLALASNKEHKCAYRDAAYHKALHRLPSKTGTFAIIYGSSALGLVDTIISAYLTEGIEPPPVYVDAGEVPPSLLEQYVESGAIVIYTQPIIDGYFSTYPGVGRWMAVQHKRMKRHGMVWDAIGRIRLMPKAYSVHDRFIAKAGREAGNMPVQGSAQATIKIGMAVLWHRIQMLRKAYQLGIYPIMQIHDELIFEVENSFADEFAAMGRHELENVVKLSVPVKSSADMAEKWGELK